MQPIAFTVRQNSNGMFDDFCAAGNFIPGTFEQSTFPGGAPRRKLCEPHLVEGREVIVLGSMAPHEQEAMRAIAMVARKFGAERLNYVYTYFNGSRKDRPDDGVLGDCVTAEEYAITMATVPQANKISRHYVFDIHNPWTLQAFSPMALSYEIPGNAFWEQFIAKYQLNDCTVASADKGRHHHVVDLAQRLKTQSALITATRLDATHKRIDGGLIGDVVGKELLIREDILASGGTVEKGAQFYLDQGAKSVRAVITHCDFDNSMGTIERLQSSPYLETVFVTDSSATTTIPKGFDKLWVIPCGGFLGAYLQKEVFYSRHGNEG